MNEAVRPLLSIQAKRSIYAIIALRSFFFCIFIFLLNKSIDFGTSPYLLSFGAVVGIALATRLAFSQLTTRGFLIIALIIYLAFRIFFFFFDFLPFTKPGWFFTPLVIEQHASLTLLFCFLSASLAWLFWRMRHALTLEILALLSLSIELLAGHRNFHFESPRILNNLAWSMGAQQLSVLILIGASILFLLSTYVFMASIPYRPSVGKNYVPVERNKGRLDYISMTLISLAAAALIYIICLQLFNYYQKEAMTRTTNGVGENAEAGLSPLDFHSALGSTNQPGALVRLEGDYAENPFNPMLYFRESALSEFNGHEMVVASANFDRDVSAIDPSQSFKADEDPRPVALKYSSHIFDSSAADNILWPLLLSNTADIFVETTDLSQNRQQLVQSIYLLTEHKLAFAVDYPVSIVQLKNPNPKRFKGSYRATSLAPVFALDSIHDAGVGDPNWSPETWQHYLQPHPDKRYAELAMQITNSFNSPATPPTAAKAFAIIQYLSKNAIYTLTPNHEVKPDEDPVAPFLFGDKRGYCVHFAHATVYMLRALGIPARIGTGYLTDLSQSRDGHILLRMSDRHAWAEVYITGRGWVAFDTQPEHVESHAESQVDMKLLEDLMAMLGPGEEILPSDIAKDEPNLEEPPHGFSPQPSHVFLILGLVLSTFALIKFYLRFGWLFAANPRSKLKRSYIAVASRLYDIGQQRLVGETRFEFQKRMQEKIGMQSFGLTDILNRANYDAQAGILNQEINMRRKSDLNSLSSLSFWKKLAAIFNPASVVAAITGSKW